MNQETFYHNLSFLKRKDGRISHILISIFKIYLKLIFIYEENIIVLIKNCENEPKLHCLK